MPARTAAGRRRNPPRCYCPTCRGVWLDRGELDKIIERSISQPAPQYTAPQHAAPQHQQPYRKPKRRESWLSEQFV